MKLWVVFSKVKFYGYSESLGAGRETRSFVAVFTSEKGANRFVLEKSSSYNERDETLEIEVHNADPSSESSPSAEVQPGEAADFFMSRQ